MITMLILIKNQTSVALNGYINPLVALLELRLKTLCISLKLGQCHCVRTVRKRTHDDIENAAKKRPVPKK